MTNIRVEKPLYDMAHSIQNNQIGVSEKKRRYNMLGAIIGDIVGSRFEFNNTDNYNFELFTRIARLQTIPFVL